MASQNLQAATRRAIAQNNLNQMGQMGTNQNQFTTELDAVEQACGEFLQRVKRNIQSANMVVTGEIENMTIERVNGNVVINGSPYVAFQDLGVQGAVDKSLAPNSPFSYSNLMPPQYVFKDYINRKNLNLRLNTNYAGQPSPHAQLTDEQMVNKAAWGMAKKIYRDGFKPQNFFNREIPQLVQDLTQNIAGFMASQLVVATEERHLP